MGYCTLLLLTAFFLCSCGGGDGSEGIVGTGTTEKKQMKNAGFQADGSIRIITE